MIPIRNIYYMFSYAFQVLNQNGYKKLQTEEFENTTDLCAAILVKGLSIQLKRGLGRDYVSVTENSSIIRGKIEISDSLQNKTILKKQMMCTHDDFSTNTYMNKIIKQR